MNTRRIFITNMAPPPGTRILIANLSNVIQRSFK
jgi:hypothetical protein